VGSVSNHYTTEANILKTIGPLFLEELRRRLAAAGDDPERLSRLHGELGRLRVFDPACGCGDFLVVAHRELRALELDLVARRGDAAEPPRVTLDHFYGIEIETGPAQLAAQRGLTVVRGNALTLDWRTMVAPGPDVVIVGNPPFAGPKERSAEQTEDLKAAWGAGYDGFLDYATGWFAKAVAYFGDETGRWAYICTNSVCQGQAVPSLWRPIRAAGWRVAFAHRSFPWSLAAVHCVIIGFARGAVTPVLIESGGTPEHVSAINAYLVDGPDVVVEKRMCPLSTDLPEVLAGSKAVDWGFLTVRPEQYAEVAADPIAGQYLRPYCGGEELINSLERWCLWFEGADLAELARSPLLRTRLAEIRARRLASPKAITRRGADTPHLFEERRQPGAEYLGIPQTFAENRRWATAARLSRLVIASMKLFTSPDPDGYLFAIVSSAMFLAWQKTVGGRLKSDPSFSNTVVWNTLPLPPVGRELRQRIIAAGQSIVDARAAGVPLARQYDPSAMAPALVAAHEALDALVDLAFGGSCASERERQRILFARYQELTDQ
jgi:hypothetical protein